jgi:hypothetical protein
VASRPFSPKRAILKFSNLSRGRQGTRHGEGEDRKNKRKKKQKKKKSQHQINHHHYHHHIITTIISIAIVIIRLLGPLPQPPKIIPVCVRAPGTRQHSTAIAVTVTNGALPLTTRISRLHCASGPYSPSITLVLSIWPSEVL